MIPLFAVLYSFHIITPNPGIYHRSDIFMFHLFSIIISYGSFLLLIMPTSRLGTISAAVALILGIYLIIHKGIYKISFLTPMLPFLAATAIFFAGFLAPGFYQRRSCSSALYVLGNILHIPFDSALLLCTLTLAALSAYILYIALYAIWHNFSKNLIPCIVASMFTVISAQWMLSIPILSMGYWNFFLGTLIVFTVILLLYCLLRQILPSIFFGTGLFMVISTINVYVYRFRGRLFEPVDIFSARTAMSVAGNYNFLPIPGNVLICWGIFILLLAVIHLVFRNPQRTTRKRYMCILAFCVISIATTTFFVSNLKTYHWMLEGASFNGYILDFVSKFKEVSAPKPDHYSAELIDDLANQYTEDSTPDPSAPPHIIVIMDEAFSDLRVLGEFSTNTEIMPFLSSLKENTISGYALASVFGGNTANSEYEFLTGNSLAWLSPNVVPYQQYIRSATYSMVSYLKSSYHYKCLAMHPYPASNWSRGSTYEHLGFDTCYYIEDFPKTNLVRGYVSDQEMFECIIETFEAQKEDPLFLFGVTIQNHGGYTYTGNDFNPQISLEHLDNEYPDAEQYLSLIYETDRAVEHLVTYFQNVDEDVVIVLFGDHQPTLTNSFYEAVSGTTADTLDKQQQRYKVPFFIWANYDIEEKDVDCTSLNYLSSYVYDVAGIALPPYNRFLQEMEEAIPSVNANGFYSLSAGRYLPFDEATGEEAHWLELYKILQYNSLFDAKHRSSTFFPALS